MISTYQHKCIIFRLVMHQYDINIKILYIITYIYYEYDLRCMIDV